MREDESSSGRMKFDIEDLIQDLVEFKIREINMLRLISPKLITALIVIALLDGIFLSQLSYDSWRMAYAKEPAQPINILIEPHPLPPNVLKNTSFGLNNLIADIIWLQTIQYYGGGDPQGKYRQLPTLLDIVSQMDERFKYPVVFNLIVLPGEGFPKDAVALGERAFKSPHFKNDWEIPYYLGSAYHFHLKNHKRAAELFLESAKRPGALEITRILAANYYANANKRETALAIYYVAYKTSKNKFVKERAKKNIDHLELVFALEDAAKKFKKKYGHFPKTLQDLVDYSIIKKIPPDPLDLTLTLNPKTGLVSVVKETK